MSPKPDAFPAARAGLAACAALACVLGGPGASAQAAAPAVPERETARADLFRIAPGADLRKLVGSPTVIGTSYRTFKDAAADENRLLGEGEIHVVLDVAGSFMADVSTDYARQAEIFPRVLSSTVLSHEGKRWVARQNMGFRFLGFVAGYDSVFETERRDLPSGAIIIEGHLTESVDAKLSASYVTWYMEPVTVDGKTLTYARFFSTQTIRRPFAGMAGLVNAFAGAELRKMVDETYKEARKRAGYKK